jgi:hypothetical protein
MLRARPAAAPGRDFTIEPAFTERGGVDGTRSQRRRRQGRRRFRRRHLVCRPDAADRQISQASLGAVPVTESALEAATGTTADGGWIGSGVASLVALLKAIAVRLGVGVAPSDGGGTVAVGGTAQYLFSGLTPVNGYLLRNNSAGPLYFSDTATAVNTGASITLNPSVMWVTPPGYKPPGAVSLLGATSGAAYAARKW